MSDELTRLQEDLDPILLELGSALYVSQGFEQTLVFLLAIVDMESKTMAEGSFSAAFDSLSERTLGQLLKRLRQNLDLPKDMEVAFEIAWNSRNWIVHEFMHDTAPQMAQPMDRLQVLLRLASAKREVKRANDLANEVLDDYLAQFGTALESLKENADVVWRHLNPGPQALRH